MLCTEYIQSTLLVHPVSFTTCLLKKQTPSYLRKMSQPPVPSPLFINLSPFTGQITWCPPHPRTATLGLTFTLHLAIHYPFKACKAIIRVKHKLILYSRMKRPHIDGVTSLTNNWLLGSSSAAGKEWEGSTVWRDWLWCGQLIYRGPPCDSSANMIWKLQSVCHKFNLLLLL